MKLNFVVLIAMLALVGCGSKGGGAVSEPGPSSSMLEGTYTLSLTEEEVKEMGGLDKVPTLTLRKDGGWEMTAPPEKPMTGKYALNGENLTLTATDGEDQRLIVGDGGKTITEAVEDQPATFVLDKDKK